MLKLIVFLFTGCWHDWVVTSVHGLRGDGGAYGQRFTSRCTKCGKYKKQDLI